MMYLNLIIFLISFFSSIIQGVLGFGFGFLFMGIMPFFIPIKRVIPIGLLLALITIIRLFYPLRRYARINVIFIPLFSFFIFSNIGIYILLNYNNSNLVILFAFLLFLFAVMKIFKIQSNPVKPSKTNAFIFGSLGGLFGGVFNIGGPFFSIYYLSIFNNMNEYYATIQLTFIIGAIYNLFLHFLYGNIFFEEYHFFISGFIAILIGSFISFKIIDKINKQRLNSFIYIFLIITSIFLILKEII
jgi:uncharacterized protein